MHDGPIAGQTFFMAHDFHLVYTDGADTSVPAQLNTEPTRYVRAACGVSEPLARTAGLHAELQPRCRSRCLRPSPRLCSRMNAPCVSLASPEQELNPRLVETEAPWGLRDSLDWLAATARNLSYTE